MATARHLIAAFALFSAAIVIAQTRSAQNMPYSATEKITAVQTLSDGTHIRVETISFMAKDSSGRELQTSELPLSGDQPIMHSNLYDPITRTTTMWTSNNKQATRMHMPDPQLRSQAGFAAFGSGGPSTTARQRTEQHTEKLGTQTIAGVLAEGTRTTTTYPIGSFGNDKPIESVEETWISTDLHILVRGVSIDPRSGTHTTEVISLDRAEPDPKLFQVPSDYEIRDIYPNQ